MEDIQVPEKQEESRAWGGTVCVLRTSTLQTRRALFAEWVRGGCVKSLLSEMNQYNATSRDDVSSDIWIILCRFSIA
jgi:hypothetical protein